MCRGPSIGSPPRSIRLRRRHRPDREPVAGPEHQQPPRLEAVAGDLDRAVENIDGALLVLGIDRQRRAGLELHVGVEHLAEGRDRRPLAVEAADDERAP